MQDLFVTKIQAIVKTTLEKLGLLINEWHFGTVQSVNTDKTANIYLNGARDITPSVPFNPDITLKQGDKVWVHYVNRNINNLFIPYKRHFTDASSGGNGGTVEIYEDLTYTHSQLLASAEWLIAHNLGKYPSVSITDSNGVGVMGDIEYIDENNVKITFSSPFSGEAHLN